MTKEINITSGNYLFVEVPDDAYNFHLSSYVSNDFRQYLFVVYSYNCKANIVELGESNCSYDLFGKIIYTTKDITEGLAENVVEHYEGIMGIKRFVDYNKEYHYYDNKPIKSLQSLIQANGLDIDKNYLIIKKK